MFYIQQITNYPLQNKTLNLSDGSFVEITLKFVPQQKAWFIDSLVYGEKTINNIKVVTNPNILRQFKNILPFGIACTSTEGRDPQFAEDFMEQKCSLYLLSRDELARYEEFLSGQ